MAKPDDTLWAMEPHTKGKHIVLRSYLDAWLPIMSHGARFRSAMGKGRLVLVDGFAGPGRYATGEDGSPLVMLKAFLEHTQRHLVTADLLYLFIEERHDRIDHLRKEVEALGLPGQVDVHFEKGRFEDVFTGLLDAIESSGAQLAPTFAFIDPFGYTGNPMDLAGRFLAFQRCEALVYMPLPFVNRFVGREGQDGALTALFGSERWRDALTYKGAARIQFLHDLFQEQLRFDSPSRLVRSFEIPTAGGNGYRLYFTTGNEKGLEKMKEAMWRADPLGGECYQDTTDELVLFEPEPDTRHLLRALRRHFGDQPFSIEEAERFTLLSTAYLPKAHLKTRTLAPAERSGCLEALSSRKRKLTYPAGTRLRFL
ncbi:MAG TPA: three-Cys-motif partner protein TcmP [Solirubrobacteraceae bacterium]|jgi:three-Cys-motif partner protein|nr:three-Cys-motif partner protein TcmP [Solirubrobacteraceae bacterium]